MVIISVPLHMEDMSSKIKLLYIQNTKQNHVNNIIKLVIALMDKDANTYIKKL